jgi:hypothetical protein
LINVSLLHEANNTSSQAIHGFYTGRDKGVRFIELNAQRGSLTDSSVVEGVKLQYRPFLNNPNQNTRHRIYSFTGLLIISSFLYFSGQGVDFENEIERLVRLAIVICSACVEDVVLYRSCRSVLYKTENLELH